MCRVVTHKIVKLDSGNTLVDTRDDLLCDCSGINMFWIKTIAES